MSNLENEFLFQLNIIKLPSPTLEFKFHKKRKFRFDFAWVHEKIAVEIQGGTFSRGRHVRGYGYEADCEKLNLATLDGWKLLYITAQMIKTGSGINLLEKLLGK